jgi:hypothetical protein
LADVHSVREKAIMSMRAGVMKPSVTLAGSGKARPRTMESNRMNELFLRRLTIRFFAVQYSPPVQSALRK